MKVPQSNSQNNLVHVVLLVVPLFTFRVPLTCVLYEQDIETLLYPSMSRWQATISKNDDAAHKILQQTAYEKHRTNNNTVYLVVDAPRNKQFLSVLRPTFLPAAPPSVRR